MRRLFVKMSAAAIIAASTVAALQCGASASTHVPVPQQQHGLRRSRHESRPDIRPGT